jgi:hypothetical protein
MVPIAARPSIARAAILNAAPWGIPLQERWQRSGPAHRLFASSLRILFGFSKI